MKIDFDKILAASKELKGNIVNTPFVRANKLSSNFNTNIFLKLENLQLTSSFKARGACYAIMKHTLEDPNRGIITMSAGNHAQAVAYFANEFNVSSTIIMPEQAPFSKVSRTKELGANVILKGRTLNETSDFVNNLAKEKNLKLIHPYDDYDVILGQGSIGIEIFEKIKELDCIVIPIGGGGLISGISIVAKKINPKIKIFGVESDLYPSAYNKFKKKNLFCSGDTIADGIAVKTPGEKTFPIIREYIDDIILVDDISIENTISNLFEYERIISEGAGAAGVTAIIENLSLFKNKKVCSIICGGNIDSRIYAGILNKKLSRDGRLARIRIGITDEPGMLSKISNAIAKTGGNIIEIYHQRMFHDVPVKKAKIDAVIEAQNKKSIEEIITTLKSEGFEVRIINETFN